ncbi:MAG: zinc transport system substrate-binding protein [Frankiaceae bacterium]|jgi:zinc transport system substrate-binding protein|nr:zinc transport system substrate-binding protein [Frankiaceae bacterium]MDX6223654.1 zinc transport system substrate-binding protein [Frankiales bacterium]
MRLGAVMRRALSTVLAPALLTACLTACSNSTAGSSGSIDVVAGFYPLVFLAERIGGIHVTVKDLTPAGAEPHDIELTAHDVVKVREADLVLYLHGLAPAVDEAAGESKHALDVAAVTDQVSGYSAIEEGEKSKDTGLDPHVWLDLQRMGAIATAVRDRLVAADAAHADDYRQNASTLAAELFALDADFKTGLAHCARKDIVTSHNAFGYLARRYGLTQVGISGLVPDAEPAPGRLAEVTDYARHNHVTTIYFESIVSPKVAQTVANSIGARTAVLDPIESKPRGGDYLDGMRRNLAALRAGLGCG